jgi:glycyl-tRNA synthetase beta chain
MTRVSAEAPKVLLEIGTEEIPARFLPLAMEDLKRIASALFSEYRIGFDEVKTYATPRRIVLLVSGIEPNQRDMVKEVFGPSRQAAFDEKGNPTRAAEGFANSLGLKPSDLQVKKKGKADYMVAIIEEKGEATERVLPELLKKAVLALRFPKAMRWGSGSLYFVRPIHWIVAIYAGEPVPFEIDGITSGNITRGHRFLSPASFQIKDLNSYMSSLSNNFVVLDHEKRAQLIRKGIESIASQAGGQPVMDEDLVTTVNFLVEFPMPVLCGFGAEYLKLPKELLITVMKDHQKYFAVQDDDGRLLNKFVVISNTRADNSDTVRVGAEKVIKARFDDAKFYFHEDGGLTLGDRVESLKKVTFHDRLGSLFDKTGRIVSIAVFLASRIDPSIETKLARAALLSKTDLITGVVREFPELQGVMGKYYALRDGEDGRVAAALEEQYLPKSFGGRLPEGDTGALLSIADKADSVSAFFAIGVVPTGSEDPFALRRQAMGIISIVIDRGYDLSLSEIFSQALKNLSGIRSKGNPAENLRSFMEQRVEFILSSAGHDQDLINSVLHLSWTSPLKSVTGRIEALAGFKKEAVFPDFLLGIKRVSNIIPKEPLAEVREGLLSQEEERNLYASFRALRERIEPLLKEDSFSAALLVLSEITPAVNLFFDRVLVMDKQEEIRINRLSLLKEIWTTASAIADFSKLS